MRSPASLLRHRQLLPKAGGEGARVGGGGGAAPAAGRALAARLLVAASAHARESPPPPPRRCLRRQLPAEGTVWAARAARRRGAASQL